MYARRAGAVVWQHTRHAVRGSAMDAFEAHAESERRCAFSSVFLLSIARFPVAVAAQVCGGLLAWPVVLFYAVRGGSLRVSGEGGEFRRGAVQSKPVERQRGRAHK